MIAAIFAMKNEKEPVKILYGKKFWNILREFVSLEYERMNRN
jgi:hypothetical protein